MSLLKINIQILKINNRLVTISNPLANKLGLSYGKYLLSYGKYLNTLSKSWIIAFSVFGIIAFSVSQELRKIAFSPLGIRFRK